MPDQVTVVIRSESDRGDVYEERFPLDVDLVQKRTYVESSISPDSQLREGVDHLETIAKAVGALARERSRGPTPSPLQPGFPRRRS